MSEKEEQLAQAIIKMKKICNTLQVQGEPPQTAPFLDISWFESSSSDDASSTTSSVSLSDDDNSSGNDNDHGHTFLQYPPPQRVLVVFVRGVDDDTESMSSAYSSE